VLPSKMASASSAGCNTVVTISMSYKGMRCHELYCKPLRHTAAGTAHDLQKNTTLELWRKVTA